MTTNERVEAILKVSSLSRNSDKELLIIFVQKMGMDLTPHQVKIFNDMPSAETITRHRRLLQEQGKYPPTEAVEQARYENYKQVKETIQTDGTIDLGNRIVLPYGQ